MRAYITEVEDDYARPIVTRTYSSSWSMYDDHLVGRWVDGWLSGWVGRLSSSLPIFCFLIHPLTHPPTHSQYPGGSCRLHMLRKLLGDEVFWRAVKVYVER